jgi:hypothetical protein
MPIAIRGIDRIKVGWSVFQYDVVDVTVAERRAYQDTKPPDTTKDPAPRSINPYPVASVFANRRGKT